MWKPRHYERHDNIPEELLGTQINRYTVPIQHIAETKYGNIYLVIQFCTDNLEMPYFPISKEAFTKDLKANKEYVYVINVRLCFEHEFKTHRKKPYFKGEVKEEYRSKILLESLDLVHNTKRRKTIIKFIKDKNYLYMSKDELEKIIKSSQFSFEERIYKGIVKEENNKK